MFVLHLALQHQHQTRCHTLKVQLLCIHSCGSLFSRGFVLHLKLIIADYLALVRIQFSLVSFYRFYILPKRVKRGEKIVSG